MLTKTNSSLPSSSFFNLKETSQINQNLISKTPDELKQMKNLLNSQRIELLFGHYEIELLSQKGNVRVSSLNSNGIMRTCAVVHFTLPVPVWLETTHNKIYNGGSIGQTIKESGLNLLKEDLFLNSAELPSFAKEKMGTEEPLAAIHIYKLVVIEPETSERIDYCTITEFHSPLYLTLGDLLQLSPIKTIQQNVTEVVQESLEEIRQLDELFGSYHSKISN